MRTDRPELGPDQATDFAHFGDENNALKTIGTGDKIKTALIGQVQEKPIYTEKKPFFVKE